jgi:hypothetical protein
VEHPRDFAQEAIAGGVPMRVVRPLEVVEVEDDNGELVLEAASAGDLGRERLLEGAAVRDPGERVHPRLAGALLGPANRP